MLSRQNLFLYLTIYRKLNQFCWIHIFLKKIVQIYKGCVWLWIDKQFKKNIPAQSPLNVFARTTFIYQHQEKHWFTSVRVFPLSFTRQNFPFKVSSKFLGMLRYCSFTKPGVSQHLSIISLFSAGLTILYVSKRLLPVLWHLIPTQPSPYGSVF